MCELCNEMFLARACYINRRPVRFCSRKCRCFSTRKETTIEYDNKPFHLDAYGYYVNKGVKLHRIIWEKHKGSIKRGYIVHHVDGDKLNNDIDNLLEIEWGKHTIEHHLRRINNEQY